MWRIALTLALPLLVMAGGPPGSSGPTCEAVLPEVKAWVGEHQMDGQDVRDQMMARIDSLLARYRADASPCVSNLWLARVLLSQISEQPEDVLRLSAAYLARPVGRTDSVGVARIHSVRATTLAEMGLMVQAGQDYQAAAALVPSLPAGLASLTLRDYASHALRRRDWVAANAALDQAHRILTDSLAADPAGMRRRLGRLAVDRAAALEVRLRYERDPARRRGVARRLVDMADTAAVILSEPQDADQTRIVYDQAFRALVLSYRGVGEAELGRHGQAQATLAEAIALLSPGVRDINPYLEPEVWHRRAVTERVRGDLSAAVRSATLAREAAAAVGDETQEADAIVELGSIAERLGRLDEAERWYREAAAYRDVEWQRARFQDWSAALFGSVQQAYGGLTRVLVAQGRAAEAFAVLDGAHARALRDMRINASRRARLAGDARADVDSLIGVLRSERAALLDVDLTTSGRARAERRISILQEQIDQKEGTTDRDQAPVSIARLRSVLRAQDRALVSYLTGDRGTIAFVVTADTLVARALPTTALDIQRLMQRAGGPWRAGRPDAAVRLGPLHALHERLVRPLRDVLPARGGLVVIPDGLLADLPFEMLVEAPAQDYASARYLVRRQPVSTDLAAALIVADAGPAAGTPPLDLVAFGRSRFEGPNGLRRGRSGSELGDLPNVVEEIRSIRGRVGNRETALDADATEARFVARAGSARVVHIASHAEADPAYPLHSRIYLWDDPDDDDDGILHLFEFQDLRLPADLVVLSGCSTAAGPAHAGEGTIGLQYGVRAAGARAAVATLWPVDDRATAEILDSFYKGLADGLPKDRALQQAQVAYLDRHTGAAASPFYWAAAVLSGSPTPIPLRAPAPVWPWSVGAVALAAGAGGLAWRSRRRTATG